MEQKTYPISLDDLISVCIQLDRLIQQEAAQESDWIDQIIIKAMPLSDADVWVANSHGSDLMRLQALRDRLFNKIPPEFL
jgi:hypothetical protein